MYNVAIIGAGQLGSRHLQGLKQSSLPMKIWVMDKSEESLIIAKERYDEVEPICEKQIELVNDIIKLPDSLDLVVVATGSIPRAALVKGLLQHAEVKYMILEKILFPKSSEYDEIGKIIKEKGVKCWVNCARRLFGVFHQVESILSGSNIEMRYEGFDWGLCCNAIHLIDLFMMYTKEDKYILDTTGLIPEIIKSKRKGYIEFYGTLKATTPKGSSLTLICKKERSERSDNDYIISIHDQMNRILVDEGNSELNINGHKSSFRLPYQSETTGIYADMILRMGYIPLTSYYLSANYHREFIEKMLDYYNSLIEEKTDLLPIT